MKITFDEKTTFYEVQRRDGVAVMLLENSGEFQKLQLLHHCGSNVLCSDHLVCRQSNKLLICDIRFF